MICNIAMPMDAFLPNLMSHKWEVLFFASPLKSYFIFTLKSEKLNSLELYPSGMSFAAVKLLVLFHLEKKTML